MTAIRICHLPLDSPLPHTNNCPVHAALSDRRTAARPGRYQLPRLRCCLSLPHLNEAALQIDVSALEGGQFPGGVVARR